MLFETQKAFPYPVLRSEIDDYLDGGFQASVQFEISPTGDEITASVDILHSVEEQQALIQAGRADYVIVFECKDTFFRCAHRTEETEFSVNFTGGALRGEVTVSPFIVAREEISDFTCPLINPEFGSGPFVFPQGSVLAIDTPSRIFIEREVFRPTSSIFELVQEPSLTETQWQLRLDEDRVQIVLNPEIKRKLDRFRNDKKNKAILLNSIYFAAVMECVFALKEGPIGSEDEERWKRVIRQRCENLGLNLKSESAVYLAQRLLNDPLARFDAYLLNEDA